MSFYFLFMLRIAVGSNALDRRSVSGGLSSALERSSTAADKRTVCGAKRSSRSAYRGSEQLPACRLKIKSLQNYKKTVMKKTGSISRSAQLPCSAIFKWLPKTSNIFIRQNFFIFCQYRGIFFPCRCHNNLVSRIIMERLG